MKKVLFTCLIFIISASIYSQTTPVSPTKGIRDKCPSLKAFTNVNIIISPEEKLEDAILIIDNGYIVEVGTKISIPNGAEIFDLDGYTIYPGFIDPYTSYGIKKEKKESDYSRSRKLKFDGTRIGGNAWNDAICSEHNWVDNFSYNKKETDKFFKQGITTVQSCNLDGIFRGKGFVVNLGDDIPNNLIIKPTTVQFASLDKGSSKQEYPSSQMGSIALFRQTLYDVKWYNDAKRAYSTNANQMMPEFNCSIEALSNIYNESMLFETDDLLSMLRAKRISNEFNIPFTYVGSGEEYTNINEVKKLNANLILPVSFPETPTIKNQYDELDISLKTLRHWETAPSNPSMLEKNNIDFAFTTFGLDDKTDFLENIRKAVKRGLTPETALKALTTIPAKYCSVSNLVGTITKGKLANFIITDGDIFESKTKIFSVWIKGNKNELEKIHKLNFSGNFILNFQDYSFPLTLKGEPDKLSGSLKVDDKKKKLKNVNILLDELYFSVELDTNNLNGVVRFSGRKSDEILVGKATLPDGNSIDWTAQINPDTLSEDSTFEDSNKEKDASDDSEIDKDDDQPEVFFAQLTFPNRSFGYATEPMPENVLIKNGTVWTSEKEGILENTDILVIDGKFKSIGKNLKAPADIRIIDATGKHISAGVIDAHSHIAASGRINECSEAITAEVRIGDIIDPNSIWIYRQLAGGVTTSQILHGSCNPIGGQAQVIKLKWGFGSEELKYKNTPPTIKFALGENVKRSSWGAEHKTRYPQTRMGVETIIRDELQTALEYESKWTAYNKLNNKNKKKTIPPRKDLELDAIVEILNSRMFIHAHSYVQSEILMLMRVAEDFGFIIQNFTHILEGYKVAPEMAKHGATASSFSDWWAYKFEVYDAIPYNVALMSEKGVLSSVNSDNGDLARRLNQEAGKCVKYGNVPQEEALKFCTINSAKQLKIDEFIGSIKEGKEADFVIWNNNPLSIYAKAEQTWIEGTKFFDLETDKKLRDDLKIEKNQLIQKVLKSKSGGKGDKKINKWKMYENSFTEDKGCTCQEGTGNEY